MLGVQVPFFYFMGRKIEDEDEDDEEKEEEKGSSNMIILRKPMKDFSGLENVSEEIKQSIMNHHSEVIKHHSCHRPCGNPPPCCAA